MIKTIKEYSVFHYTNGTTRINVYFSDDTWDYYTDLDSTRAILLLDILRNEKPVKWTEGAKTLWAGREPVGEGEKKSIFG
jgi:hypothetical protein